MKNNDQYKCIKTSFKNILKPEFNDNNKKIINVIHNSHKATILVYQFLRAYCIHCVDTKIAIPNLTIDFITQVYKLFFKTTNKTKDKNVNVVDTLKSFLDSHLNFITDLDKVDSLHMCQLIVYNATDIITNVENNIKCHFKERIKKFIIAYFDNEFKDHYKKLWPSLNKKEFETKCTQAIKVITWMIMGNNIEKLELIEPLSHYKNIIQGYLFGTFTCSKGHYYNLKANPQQYLPSMIMMVKYYELKQVKLFQFFPQRTSISPKYIPIDTTLIIKMFATNQAQYLAQVGKFKSEMWSKYFNIKTKVKGYTFSGTIITDGVAVSLRFKKISLPQNSTIPVIVNLPTSLTTTDISSPPTSSTTTEPPISSLSSTPIPIPTPTLTPAPNTYSIMGSIPLLVFPSTSMPVSDKISTSDSIPIIIPKVTPVTTPKKYVKKVDPITTEYKHKVSFEKKIVRRLKAHKKKLTTNRKNLYEKRKFELEGTLKTISPSCKEMYSNHVKTTLEGIDTDYNFHIKMIDQQIENNEIHLAVTENEARSYEEQKDSEFTYFHLLPKNVQEQILKDGAALGDPGKKTLIYFLGSKPRSEYPNAQTPPETTNKFKKKNLTLDYTNARRLHETKSYKYQKILKNKKAKAAEADPNFFKEEIELSEMNCKSCDFLLFRRYLVKKLQVNRKLYDYYSNEIFRRLKWYSYINNQKSDAKLVNEIKTKFSAEKNEIKGQKKEKKQIDEQPKKKQPKKKINLIIGDWSSNSLKGRASARNIGLKRMLSKHFNLYLIDEFRTSMLHHITENICENKEISVQPPIFIKKRKKRRRKKKKGKNPKTKIVTETENDFKPYKLHSVFATQLLNKTGHSFVSLINRDKNSVLNMRKIINNYVEHRKRPFKFRKGVPKDKL